MKTNWQHQKDAITTDQKNRTDDEHLHELDKRHVKQSEKDASAAEGQGKRQKRAEKTGD